MWPAELHLLRPLWLLSLVPAAILLILLWRRPAGALAWRRLVDAHLLPHLLVGEERSPRRRVLGLLALGWLLVTLALAGPVWERVTQPVFATEAARILVLDLSPSMNVADIRPSRLARARFEIMDLLNAAEEGHTALLAFGPEPFLLSPLTRDTKTIAAQVPHLTTDLIPVPGERRTARALLAAGELLARAGARQGEIILVTDGIGAIAETGAAAQLLVSEGHRISVLAVGTPDGGPVPAEAGGFELEPDGGVRIARLGEGDLRELTRLGRGRYLEAQAGDADTRALLGQRTARGEMTEAPSLESDQWREEGPWLLLALLPLAALAFRRGWLVPMLACAIILPPTPGWAFGWSDLWWRADQQAARQLEAGSDAAAAARFRDPAWRAAASYRAGDYARALAALADVPDPEADYNRGNALARLGRLDEAVIAYERVLEREPDHEDARHNLELVQALRERQPESMGGEPGGDETGEDDQAKSDGEEAGGDQASSDGDGEDARGETGSDGEGEQPGSADQSDAQTDAGAGSDDAMDRDGGQTDTSRRPEESAGSQGEPDPTSGDRAGSSQAAAGTGAGASSAPDPRDLVETEPVTLPEALVDREIADSSDPADAPNPGHTGTGSFAGVDPAARSPEALEREQALEAQLRRVPDDPGGLLRQRFLLQHLRREGRLP
jgi:Ca-activated chloride channel family protein